MENEMSVRKELATDTPDHAPDGGYVKVTV